MTKNILFAVAVVLLCIAIALPFVWRADGEIDLPSEPMLPDGDEYDIEEYDIPTFDESPDSAAVIDPVEWEAQLREDVGEEQYAEYLEAAAAGKQIAISRDLRTGKFGFLIIRDSGPDHTDPHIPEGLEIDMAPNSEEEPTAIPFLPVGEPDPDSAFRRFETTWDFGVASDPHVREMPMLEDIVDRSDCVVKATFDGYTFGDRFYYELNFRVDEAYRGVLETGDDFAVFVQPYHKVDSHRDEDLDTVTYCYDEYNFVEGDSYLLILSREESVYLDGARHRLLENTYIPLDRDVDMYMKFQPLHERVTDSDTAAAIVETSESARNAVLGYVRTLCDGAPPPEEDDILPYTLSTDLRDILEISSHVLKVRVDTIGNHSFIQNTDQCVCTVLDVWKSDSYVPSDQIYVSFFGGTVEEGGSYFILANPVDSQSKVFVLASRGGVVSPYDEEALRKLHDLVGG